MIADKLTQLGADGVSTRSADALTADEKESCNLILLGTADFTFIDEMNRIWNKLGFFCCFEDGSLNVFDGSGDSAGGYTDGVGVIQATQNPWNTSGTGVCQNMAWMVSGLDETGVENAVDVLINQSDYFNYAFGVVIIGNEIIRVP